MSHPCVLYFTAESMKDTLV